MCLRLPATFVTVTVEPTVIVTALGLKPTEFARAVTDAPAPRAGPADADAMAPTTIAIDARTRLPGLITGRYERGPASDLDGRTDGRRG